VAQGLEHVEAKRAADVHHRELRRRPHRLDALGHRADDAVGHRQEEDPAARHLEPRASGHTARVQRARKAAA
jgi:hypothetical protein